MVIAVVSGGFDPIHSGHVRMIREASNYGEELVVLVNTDEWLLRKKGYISLPVEERMEIVRAIEGVTQVRKAIDDDGTVCASLLAIHYENPGKKIVFCNGGDRGKDNTPESRVMKQIRGSMFFGVGGESKANSSSAIWPKHHLGKVTRLWGDYYDHYRDDKCVFKTLEIAPNKATSYQRHFKRHEVWFIERGNVMVRINESSFIYQEGTQVYIPPETWHSVGAGPDGATIREMQFGYCSEDDIERA